MQIILTKLTDERHRMKIVRDDGSSEEVELVTREFLAHDMLHFCLEAEASLHHSFWGSLAAGKTLSELSAQGMATNPPSEEVMITESIVGPLSYIAKGGTDDAQFLSIMTTVFQSRSTPMPAWLTEELLGQIRKCFVALMGEYRALPRGERMVLAWPVKRLSSPI
jgi:hypothetical protein